MPKLQLRRKDDTLLFPVRVAPRASRDTLAGLHDVALKVALTAPPVDGAANAALVKFLAKTLGVPKRDVVIVSGHKGRDKRVAVRGVDEDTLRSRLCLS